VIFLDQRGTNGKHRLACEPIPFVLAEAPQQQVDDWMQECLSKLDGDPRFYTTAEAMRDLDDARAALGYDKINLYGISYGAAAVQVYMRMFPERVRTAVIDHGTALDLPFAQALPRASQSALEQVFTYCEQDQRCQDAFPDIRGDWQAVLNRLEKGPVVTNYVPPGASEPGSLDMDTVANGVHELLFRSGTYGQIPGLIHALAASEDWTAIAKHYSERYGSSGSPEPLLLMKQVIFCFDPAWGFQPEEIDRLNPGMYFRDLEVKIAKNQQKICAALPKPGPSQIYGPGKPTPLSALMFNSLLDPQNPPSNMAPALKEFTRSRVIVEPTEGHDTSGPGCRWQIMTQYIQQGTVEGLDTGCMDGKKPYFETGN
jgi:pimeloyl-ACP methyl ester carboxylesterase